MPYYDYRCEKGHTFEVSQRMADDPLDSCEKCGAPAERILHSPAARVMDGSINATTRSAGPKAGEEKSPLTGGSKDEGGSWLDSVEPRKTPPTTFRRALRRK